MKNKHRTYIRKKALQIIELEQQIRLGKNVQSNQQKIQGIMSTLSMEDILFIDDYIRRSNLLTK